MNRKEYEKELYFLYDKAHNAGDIHMAWEILREIYALVEFPVTNPYVPLNLREQRRNNMQDAQDTC